VAELSGLEATIGVHGDALGGEMVKSEVSACFGVEALVGGIDTYALGVNGMVQGGGFESAEGRTGQTFRPFRGWVPAVRPAPKFKT
jgi:hypothetical protein